MSKVIVREASYSGPTLKPLLFEMLDSFCGSSVGRKSRVLIKPNLLAPAPPDRAITTHPLIVRAAVEYVLEKGGLPQVSDSPAMGSFDRVMRESGIAAALEGLPVVCRPFSESVMVDIGKPFHKIEIAAEACGADAVINLPKLKTHTQMLLTLGVKNIFGCIVGMRKPQWHLRAGTDRDSFAELLVRIYGAVKPAVTLLDGILALEGQGPGRGGEPRTLGLVAASDNAVALDMAVSRMLGLGDEDLLTNREALRLGLGPAALEIDGDLPQIRDMKLPSITPLVFGPKGLHRFMRKHLVQRPVCSAELCRHCGECWRYCPAKAIEPELKGLKFDYDRCIRCYCCLEVCPYGALEAREALLGSTVRKVFGI